MATRVFLCPVCRSGRVAKIALYGSERKPREEFSQSQEERRQSLAEHPGATVREIATHFGKSSSSTMQAWLDKLTTGV